MRPPGQSTRRGLSSPSLRGITSTTWSIDRGTCPSSLSSWRRGCHLRPSRPRRSKSTSSTRSDIVQVRAELLVRLPGVAVGAVALPEARKHVPVADAAVGAHPLQHNLLVQDSPLSVPAQRLVALREIGKIVCITNRGRQWSVQYEESSQGAVALTNRLLCACGPERVFPSIVHTLTPSGRQVAQCAGSGVGRPCDELCRKRRLNSD